MHWGKNAAFNLPYLLTPLHESHKMTAFVLEVLGGVSDLVSQVAVMATVWLSKAHCRPTDPCMEGIFPWVDASEHTARQHKSAFVSTYTESHKVEENDTLTKNSPLFFLTMHRSAPLSLLNSLSLFFSPSSRVSLFIHLIRFHSASLLCLLSPSLILNRQTQQCY